MDQLWGFQGDAQDRSKWARWVERALCGSDQKRLRCPPSVCPLPAEKQMNAPAYLSLILKSTTSVELDWCPTRCGQHLPVWQRLTRQNWSTQRTQKPRLPWSRSWSWSLVLPRAIARRCLSCRLRSRSPAAPKPSVDGLRETSARTACPRAHPIARKVKRIEHNT